MKKFDWISTISINLFVLKFVGLWPRGESTYEFNFYTFNSIVKGIIIIGGHNLSQIINIFFVYTDLEALTATIFVMITNILATVKMYFYVRNLKLVKRLIFILKNDPDFQPKSIAQVELIEPHLKLWKIFYWTFNIIVATNLLLWIMSPCFNENQRLPFAAWYPFGIDTTPNYQIVYGYQVLCILYITAANLNLDTITYALMMYIYTQCDILCGNLYNIDGDKVSFKDNLIKCIIHHKKIISFAKESNHIFNVIILGQFITSTMALAMTMFQLSLVEPVSTIALTHLFYITGMTTQIFLYCWYGNEIEFKSSQICYALFNSNWFGQSAKAKRTMLIFSERCQKPVKITAIGLFALSLKTFMAILRTSWSYFALLCNVNNG